MFTRQRAALAVIPAIVVLGSAGIVRAADIVIHAKVLSVNPTSHTFRVLVQETRKERTVFVTDKTVFRSSNGKSATFADVKVGRMLEIKGQEKSADAYTASAVTIRL